MFSAPLVAEPVSAKRPCSGSFQMTDSPSLSRDSSTPRYVVGCAGQFAYGGTRSADDEDVAIAMCGDEYAPVGCEVYDREAKRWLGPTCQEEIDEARARLAARAAS